MHYERLKKDGGLKAWRTEPYRITALSNPPKGLQNFRSTVGFRQVEMEDFNLRINGVPCL